LAFSLLLRLGRILVGICLLLIDSILQSQGSSAHVPKVTAKHVFVDANITCPPPNKLWSKILPKRKFQENAKTSKFQQLGYIFYKTRTAQTIKTTNNFLFFAGQKLHFFFQH